MRRWGAPVGLVSVSPTVWAQIRQGRAPTPILVAQVLDGEAVVLGEAGVLRARTELAAHVLGAGPLEPLLADPQVTDVLVNAGSGVWVDRGDGLARADCEVGDEPAVRRLAVRLAGIAGRRLDDTSPYVDGLLPGGVPSARDPSSHRRRGVPHQLAGAETSGAKPRRAGAMGDFQHGMAAGAQGSGEPTLFVRGQRWHR